MVSSVYRLIPGDLRAFGDLHDRLEELLDPSLPTLLIAECVFIYLDERYSDGILQWFVEHYSAAGLACLLYDPVGLHDSFGKVMINNLQVRHAIPARPPRMLLNMHSTCRLEVSSCWVPDQIRHCNLLSTACTQWVSVTLTFAMSARSGKKIYLEKKWKGKR